MGQHAVVDARGASLFIGAHSATEVQILVRDEWVERADAGISDEELGALVRQALAHSRSGIPFPDYWKGERPPGTARLHALAGVNSDSAYMRGVRSVHVDREEGSPSLIVAPWRKAGTRGFEPVPGQEITLDASIDDAVLGAAVRRALDPGRSGT